MAETGQDRIRMQASARVLYGADAAQLLADLKDKNPLFTSLHDSPNAHLVVFDLTSIGRPSQHQGDMKYQLARAGLAAALPTLIAKPIHVTADLQAHFTQGQSPRPIGAFLGSTGIEEEDGAVTLRAIGTLWSDDFPDEVAEITRRAAELGASYEIMYAPEATKKLAAGLTEIEAYQFSGGAILKKSHAAHPETQVLVADTTTEIVPTVTTVTTTTNVPMPESPATLEELQQVVADVVEHLEGEELSFKERIKLKDSDFALVEKSDRGLPIRKFPIHDEAHRKNAWARLPQADLTDAQRSTVADKVMSRAKSAGDDWAKPYKKVNGKWVKTKEGATMTMSTKYPGGILAEHDTAVAAIVSSALEKFAASMDPAAPECQLADLLEDTKKKLAQVRASLAELPALREKSGQHDGFVSKVAELNTELTAAKAKLAEYEPQMAELTTLRAEKAETDKIAGLDAIWTKLKAQFGLTDDQRADKQPVIEKLYAGSAMTAEDVIHLTTGAKGTAGQPVPQVPLMAGGTTPTQGAPDLAALKRNFPALANGPRYR